MTAIYFLNFKSVSHTFPSLLSLFPKEEEKIYVRCQAYTFNPLLDLKGILGYTNISVKKKVMMDGGLSKHYFRVNNDSLPQRNYVSKNALKVGSNLLKSRFQI